MSNHYQARSTPLQHELVEAIVSPQLDYSYERILQSPVMQYDTQRDVHRDGSHKVNGHHSHHRSRKHTSSKDRHRMSDKDVHAQDYTREEPRHHHRRSSRNTKRDATSTTFQRPQQAEDLNVYGRVPILGENYILGVQRREMYKKQSKQHPNGNLSPRDTEMTKQHNSKIPSVDQLVAKLMEVTDNWSGTLDELAEAHKELEKAKLSVKSNQEELNAANAELQKARDAAEEERKASRSLEEQVVALQRQLSEFAKQRQAKMEQQSETEAELVAKLDQAKSANQDMEEQLTKLMLDKVRLQQELHQQRNLLTPKGELGEKCRMLQEENDALKKSIKLLVEAKGSK